MTANNNEVRKYHELKEERNIPAHGNYAYADAKKEFKQWHAIFESVDKTSNNIAHAASTFLGAQGESIIHAARHDA